MAERLFMDMDVLDFVCDTTDSEDELMFDYVEKKRAPKQYKTRNNDMGQWGDEEFRERFRVSKQTVTRVLEEIQHDITHITNRNHCYPPLEQILTTLLFFATGDTYVSIGELSGMHRTTVCRTVTAVSSALKKLLPKYIRMPAEDVKDVNEDFFRISYFPDVIGAMGCSHIRIKFPGGDNSEEFKNRKGYYSFKVQTVVDANLRIRDVLVRWPGSAYDTVIYNSSQLRARAEIGEFGKNVILCGPGYAVGSNLLPPLPTPQLREERLYNEAHTKTRNVVQRFYRAWKAQFPVLSVGIKQKIGLTQEIIVACAVLYNIAREYGDVMPAVQDEDDETSEEEDIVVLTNPRRDDLQRQYVNYFKDLL